MITAKVLLTELEILLKHNEDDFDRGGGKIILQNFIQEMQDKIVDDKYYSMMSFDELIILITLKN
jgi:hypothetical protein